MYLMKWLVVGECMWPFTGLFFLQSLNDIGCHEKLLKKVISPISWSVLIFASVLKIFVNERCLLILNLL